jgi:hypothetical protein
MAVNSTQSFEEIAMLSHSATMHKIKSARRRFIMCAAAAAIAVAAASAPVVRDAQAQTVQWQELRRDDLGFRIEMPGNPTIEETKGLPRENLIRSIDAKAEYDQVSLEVGYAAYKNVSIDEFIKSFRSGLSVLGSPIDENSLTINGFPAREFTVAPGIVDGAYYRFVFVGNAVFSIQAVGGSSSNPTIRRFVDSFRLLVSAK